MFREGSRKAVSGGGFQPNGLRDPASECDGNGGFGADSSADSEIPRVLGIGPVDVLVEVGRLVAIGIIG
jgi:hypothetical protein